MTSWLRRPAVLVTVGGLAAAALGDLAQGWDGPGPVVFGVLAIAVAALPSRVLAAVAALVSALFVVGALSNPGSIARLTDPADVAGFASGVLQLLGFVLAAVAGTAVALRRPSVPGPADRPVAGR